MIEIDEKLTNEKTSISYLFRTQGENNDLYAILCQVELVISKNIIFKILRNN